MRSSSDPSPYVESGEHAPAALAAGHSLADTTRLLQERAAQGNPSAKPATQPTLGFDRQQPALLARQLDASACAEATVVGALDACVALLGQHETAWRAQDAGLLVAS